MSNSGYIPVQVSLSFFLPPLSLSFSVSFSLSLFGASEFHLLAIRISFRYSPAVKFSYTLNA